MEVKDAQVNSAPRRGLLRGIRKDSTDRAETASCLLEELYKLEVALYVSFRIDGIKEGQTEEATKIADMLLKTKEGQAVSEQLLGSLQRGI